MREFSVRHCDNLLAERVQNNVLVSREVNLVLTTCQLRLTIRC